MKIIIIGNDALHIFEFDYFGIYFWFYFTSYSILWKFLFNSYRDQYQHCHSQRKKSQITKKYNETNVKFHIVLGAEPRAFPAC